MRILQLTTSSLSQKVHFAHRWRGRDVAREPPPDRCSRWTDDVQLGPVKKDVQDDHKKVATVEGNIASGGKMEEKKNEGRDAARANQSRG